MAAILLAVALQSEGVDGLIERLGGDDLEKREAAAAELRKIGAPAVEALRKAAREKGERAARARDVLDDILFRTRGRLAFWGACDDAQAVFVADPDGEAKPAPALKGVTATYDATIRWVPGRREIVVSADLPQEERHGLGCFPDLWIVSSDGRESKRLTRERGTSEFAVSPDGSTIAYVTYGAGGGSEIGAIGTDGANARRLTDGMWKVWEPAWFPDGTAVLFRGGLRKDGKPVEGSRGMYRVGPDGKGLEKVAGDVSFPEFTPDGKGLVALEYVQPQKAKELYALDLDKWARRTIAKGAAFDQAPGLSPDGTRVAFVRHESREIVAVGIDGAKETVVAKGEHPAWSPDGTRLAFTREFDVVVIDLASNQEKVVGKGSRPSWSK
jgi:Tol biopolymer transport system component